MSTLEPLVIEGASVALPDSPVVTQTSDAAPASSWDMPAAETNSTGDLEDASRSNEDKWNEMAKQMGDTRIDNDQSHPNGVQSRDHSPPPVEGVQSRGHSPPPVEGVQSRGHSPPPVEDVDSPATIEDAWPGFWEADQSRDLDDVKPALARLCEQYRGRSWADLDSKLRAENCNTYLVATEDQVSFGYTLVNLRGEPNQRYRVIPSFIKPGTVKKGRMAIGMAASYEENQSRLDDAGVVRPSGVPRCHNCKKEGHIMSDCPEGRRDIERSEYFGKCYNCGSEDHRTRHCQEPRKVITCRNCGQEGHMSRDCSEPEAPTVCNRCNEEGHFSRDCTQPRTDVTCRRCNQMGHMARECPEPDIEITCNTCNQPGHMARDCAGAVCNRCRQPGHISRDCGGPRNEPICNRCNQPGHIARDCSQPRMDIVCYRCNQPGHMSRDCSESRDETICNRCKQPGHIARDCHEPGQQSSMNCFRCNGFGHRASDCTNEPAPGAEERRPSRYDRYGFSDGF